MFTGGSPGIYRVARNAALVGLSLAFLWLDLSITVICLGIAFIRKPRLPVTRPKSPRHGAPNVRPTVLITGLSSSSALTIARSLSNHPSRPRIIGADSASVAPGLFSKSITRRFTLSPPSPHAGPDAYVLDLHSLVVSEKVDLWIPCSRAADAAADAVAMEAIVRTTGCKCVQFDVPITEALTISATFLDHTKRLGLAVPEAHRVNSKSAAERILSAHSGNGKRYTARAIRTGYAQHIETTQLPMTSARETSDYLSRLAISSENPWLLQEVLDGKQFCTHSLIVRGRVATFVASACSDHSSRFVALSSASPLAKAMLHFTKTFVQSSEARFTKPIRNGDVNARNRSFQPSLFTGHLSFDFVVPLSKLEARSVDDVSLHPVECKINPHTAISLLSAETDMAEAYLSVLSADNSDLKPIVPVAAPKIHWVAHDLISLVILPAIHLFRHPSPRSLLAFARSVLRFQELGFYWKDGTFSSDDPLPWFVQNHVYWPLRCIDFMLSGTHWERLDLSTGEIFQY